MTPRRFRELLDTFGGDLSRWPLEARAEAHRLLETSDEAREALAEAQSFDQILSARDTLSSSRRAELVGRIMDAADAAEASAGGGEATAPAGNRPVQLRYLAAGLAACCVAGFLAAQVADRGEPLVGSAPTVQDPSLLLWSDMGFDSLSRG